MSTTMKAYAIQKFGPGEALEAIELPIPEAPPGHVVIRVAASSVNPLDVKIRNGVAMAFAPALPAILHGDVSGTVHAVGPGVIAFAPGDEVYGYIGGIKGTSGALAEFALADARMIARRPGRIPLEDAAALPLVTLTAWEALVDRARVQAGDRVLIHGGAGGVGHVAIQIAKARGAKVYATVSAGAKSGIARELGADVVIDYARESVDAYVTEHTAGQGFDVVFDTIGGTTLDASFRAVRSGGQVVTISARSTHDLSPLYLKGVTLHVVLMLIPTLTSVGRAHQGEILRRAAELVDSGRLRPLIDPERFAFADAADAHQRLESGRSVGKILLTATA